MALPRTLAALACGLLFGLGLAISGMMNPAKVIGFLDVAGAWDPTLAFVMGGALLVRLWHGTARLDLRRTQDQDEFVARSRRRGRGPSLGTQ